MGKQGQKASRERRAPDEGRPRRDREAAASPGAGAGPEPVMPDTVWRRVIGSHVNWTMLGVAVMVLGLILGVISSFAAEYDSGVSRAIGYLCAFTFYIGMGMFALGMLYGALTDRALETHLRMGMVVSVGIFLGLASGLFV